MNKLSYLLQRMDKLSYLLQRMVKVYLLIKRMENGSFSYSFVIQSYSERPRNNLQLIFELVNIHLSI